MDAGPALTPSPGWYSFCPRCPESLKHSHGGFYLLGFGSYLSKCLPAPIQVGQCVFSQGVFHRVFTARAARWENDSAEFTDKPDFNGYVFLFIIVVSSTYSAYHYHPHAV